MRKIPQHVREKQLRELAQADGYSFVGWVDGYKDAHSKVIMSCANHGGWYVTADRFIRGGRCPVCARDKRKIPQDVREKQIREVAEADGYTFIGWVNGYKDSYSNASIECPDHGVWTPTVNDFINNGHRCPRCHGGTHISRLAREQQIREVAEADGYTFDGWVDGCVGVRGKIIITCGTHGVWTPTVGVFISGCRCPQCAIDKRKTPQGDQERQLNEIAEADGYTFVGWVNGYNGVNSKTIINCPSHGDWIVPAYSFVVRGRRCHGCSTDRQRLPQATCEQQIREVANADGYSFVGWVDGYTGVKSKFIARCNAHGEWSVAPHNFINLGQRCPSCATSGYLSTKNGTLYALISDCRSMVKIGISNVPDKRHAILGRATPFSFTIYRQLHCDDGSVPPVLERMFHDQFPSAGLVGFDGATEWRQMNPDITTWLDLLGAQ